MQTFFILFLLGVSIQFIYLILFLTALSKNSQVHRNKIAEIVDTPVSVIVCAHDEEQNLRELLPLLLNQQHQKFELIIVNDRSNDGTFDYLLAETKKHPQVKMVDIKTKPQHMNAKKYAITLAIKAATYDWIVLTDADCRPMSDLWLRSLSEAIQEDKEIILGYSPYAKEKGWLNLFIRFETLFTGLQYVSFALLKKPYMGVGRNLAYKKSLFLENKGFGHFNDVTGGDDDLFVNQHANERNTSVVVGEESLVESLPKRTIQSFYFQKVRHLSTGKKYKLMHRLLLGTFTLSHMLTWFTGLLLIFTLVGWQWVVPLMAARLLLVTVAVHQASTRFGQKFEWWTVPFLDFVFVIYYLSTAPVALLTKKLRWRN